MEQFKFCFFQKISLAEKECQLIHDFSFADLLTWNKERYHNSTETHLNLTYYDWFVYQAPGGISYGLITLVAKWIDDRAANFFSKRHGMERHMLMKVIFFYTVNIKTVVFNVLLKNFFSFLSFAFRSFWPWHSTTFSNGRDKSRHKKATWKGKWTSMKIYLPVGTKQQQQHQQQPEVEVD